MNRLGSVFPSLLDVHAPTYNLFNLGRRLMAARFYPQLRQRAFATWVQPVVA
ncbi:MAG: hypothetical protein ACI9W2_003168 [Gammaproteobacteria bacterium]|jgi:hypothetical protein